MKLIILKSVYAPESSRTMPHSLCVLGSKFGTPTFAKLDKMNTEMSSISSNVPNSGQSMVAKPKTPNFPRYRNELEFVILLTIKDGYGYCFLSMLLFALMTLLLTGNDSY